MNRTPAIPLALAALLAIVGGAVLWLAFPPVGVWAAAPVGVGLLTLAAWGASWRRGLGMGALAGAAFFLLLLEWMRVIGIDAWLALTALCAAWVALVGLGTALVTRLPAAPVWVGAVWVLSEALRGRVPLGGFPWGELAFSQPGSPVAGWAPLGGSALASFAVAFTGAALVAAGLAIRERHRGAAGAWAVVVLGVVLVPMLVPSTTAGDDVGGDDSATVAVVQGGTPQVGMGAMDVRRAVLDNHVEQTLALAAAIDAGEEPQPDFVLWPENASDLDPFADTSVADAITAAARAVGAPILVGAVTAVPGDPGGVWNVGIVWDPEAGPTEMYIKTHPVPFGEYVPFREQLAGLIGRFDRVPRDFRPGDEPGNLTIGGVEVGNVICFEIAYREVVDAVIDGGARLLTVQTNNATYGGTSQPAQQLGIERLRAREFGRTTLVAATSGISAGIAADGTLTHRMDEGETGWFVMQAPLRGTLTLASRTGHLVVLLLSALGFGAMIVAVVRSRRRAPDGIA